MIGQVESFMGLIDGYDESEIVVWPISYEGTVTYGKGTSKGPGAIISASYQVEPYSINTKKVFEEKVHTLPLFDLAGKDPEQTVEMIEKEAEKHSSKFLLSLGGEHSLSIGLIKAKAKDHPHLCVLQIDAHSDLSDSYEGSRYNHACVMRRVLDLGCKAVQTGVRSLPPGISEEIENLDTDIFFANNLAARERDDWIDDVLERLGKDVYVTIDIDGLDPSLMPATGTPEPGGLFWYDIIGLLQRVFKAKNVVGCDIVELSPIRGMYAPDYIAAKLAFEILSMKTCYKRE